MCREEQAVLVTAGSSFRLEDVGEACHRNLQVVDAEHSTLAPNDLEIETSHDEGEIHFQAGTVGCPNQCSIRDHSLGKATIARSVERLRTAEQIETQGFASAPGRERVLGIGWEKEVTIFRREQLSAGPGVVIRPGKPDDEEPDTRPRQRLDQTLEGVAASQRTRTALA